MSEALFLNDAYPGPGVAEPPASGPPTRRPRPSWFTELIRVAFPTPALPKAAAVLFAAPHPGCGVSYLCTSIACELAAAGAQAATNTKVLLADAEVILNLAGRESAVPLCERIDLAADLTGDRASAPSGVWVLGRRQLNRSHRASILAPALPTHALDSLKREFTHILIDAPALSTSDAALTLSTLVDGSIFVAAAGQTETRQIQHMHRKFTSLGGRVLGSIYNAY